MSHDRSLGDRLSEPFDPREVKFKPQLVKNNKALSIAYVDVRLVEDRLDAVMGVENWQDSYDVLNDGSVVCRLALRFGDQWVTKTDVGSPSEQPDGGDRLKAAFSDALKRCAIKFGIGRYLYRLPGTWMDYDPVKKQIVGRPQLPDFALPYDQQRQGSNRPQANAQQSRPASPPPSPPPAAPASALPVDGAELHRRLQDKDAKLAAEKVCPRGTLLSYVVASGMKAGYPANLTEWAGPAIEFAVKTVKEYEQQARAAAKPAPQPAAR